MYSHVQWWRGSWEPGTLSHDVHSSCILILLYISSYFITFDYVFSDVPSALFHSQWSHTDKITGSGTWWIFVLFIPKLQGNLHPPPWTPKAVSSRLSFYAKDLLKHSSICTTFPHSLRNFAFALIIPWAQTAFLNHNNIICSSITEVYST